jgi:hypothetical protein
MPGLHEYLYGIRPSDVLVLGTNQEQKRIQVFRVCVVSYIHADVLWPLFIIENTQTLAQGIMYN